MQIVVGALKSTRVAEEGQRIILRLADAAGVPVELHLSVADAGAIAMTLPRLLRMALRETYRDDTLRYVYPLEGWQVEAASDGVQVILTLRTGEGFETSFAAPPTAFRALGSSLRRGPDELPTLRLPVVN